MKKTYMTPEIQVFKVQTNQIMTLSLTDNNGSSLSSGDFDENGDFEICTKEQKGWGMGW